MRIHCKDMQEKIADYLQGVLDSDNAGNIEQHMEQCYGCRMYYEQLKQDDILLDKFVSSISPSIEKIENNVIDAVLESLNSKKPVFFRYAKIAIAAVILILIGLTAMFMSQSGQAPTTADNDKPFEIDFKPDSDMPDYQKKQNPIGTPAPKDQAPLPIKLPVAMFVGTPTNISGVPNLEKPRGKARPPFFAPKGVTNVALDKTVTSTDDMPIIGEVDQVTDGDKNAQDGSYVELGPFLQHVTIDLEEVHDIYAILIWHYHKQARVYFDVIVQASLDKDFKNPVTLFNNDHDNSAELGKGRDMHYVETNEGRLIDAKGIQARYIRLYSNGNNTNDLNHYSEVEVYGKPAKEVFVPNTKVDISTKSAAAKVSPLPLKLPKPMFVGTPANIQGVKNLMKPRGKPRPPFLAPVGAVNLAFEKPVTGSEEEPIMGDLEQVTDGDKEAADGSYVELGPFLQHVTIDLEQDCEIYAVVVWHFHKQARVYFDVICQVSKDKDFIETTTIYNNDLDNSEGFGVGKDMHYVETNEGRLIDAKGTIGRYVRFYSQGNSSNDLNHYIEIEVFGKPVK